MRHIYLLILQTSLLENTVYNFLLSRLHSLLTRFSQYTVNAVINIAQIIWRGSVQNDRLPFMPPCKLIFLKTAVVIVFVVMFN